MRAFSYLMIGVGAGIIIGGLFAPRSGEASRKLISRRAQKVKRSVKSAVNEGSRFVTRQSAQVRDQANQLIGHGKSVYRAAGRMVNAI